MAYFPDLSPYCYFERLKNGNEVNVGWLDAAYEFPTGIVSDEVRLRLEALSHIRVNQSRGVHDCEFCENHHGFTHYDTDEHTLQLGTAEIRVLADDDKLYASPDLLIHYITVHNYLPPQEFIDALLSGPVPPERAYFDKLDELGIYWRTWPR